MELKALVREWLNRIPEFEVGHSFIPSIVHEPRGLDHAGCFSAAAVAGDVGEPMNMQKSKSSVDRLAIAVFEESQRCGETVPTG
jgi:hypothetical protein